MSKIKLLLDVVEDIRSLADSIQTVAQAMAEGDNQPKVESKQKKTDKSEVTHEMIREIAVKLSRSGKRDEVKKLLTKYDVKNITAVAETDLEAFYNDLKSMEVT